MAHTWPFIIIQSKRSEDFHNLVRQEFYEYLGWMRWLKEIDFCCFHIVGNIMKISTDQLHDCRNYLLIKLKSQMHSYQN